MVMRHPGRVAITLWTLGAFALLGATFLLPSHAAFAVRQPASGLEGQTGNDPTILGQSQREGPFDVYSSKSERPTVRIENESEYPMQFVLRSHDGRDLQMEIAPNSENVLEADIGQYDAEVSDPNGSFGSAAGDATLRGFHEYRATFYVGPFGGGDFHIGD